MKPHRRKLPVALAALAATAAAVLLALAGWVRLSPSQPHINRSSYTRIRPGMTLEEVEALLGAPAGSRLPSAVHFDPDDYVEDANRSLPAAAAGRYA